MKRRFLAAPALLALALLAAPPARAKDPRLKWDKSWGPMVPHKKFPKDCSLCHVAKRWDVLRSDFSFDHAKETGYPLLGAHANASCLRCHNDRGPVKAYLSRGCSGCHVDPHKATLGLDCERCHTQSAWVDPGQQGRKIADHARTRFPLTGMHAVVDCRQCHLTADQGNFQAMPIDCWSCHRREYASAPNHAAQNYPQDCRTCHQTTAWVGASFSHSILGANPVCTTCHSASFATANATPASRHAANGFPQSCQNCHNFVAWGPGTAMQHSAISATPCYTCHTADFAGAPNHVSQGFSTSCQTCHSGTATWLGALFDHSSLGANPVCMTCHTSEFAAAKTTPASNHAANGFPQTCQNCHTFAAWGPGTTMQHSFVASTPCSTCHTADFAGAKSTPASNHAVNGFPATCQNCHTTTAWGPGTAMVHTAAGVPTTCQTCHTADFNSASSPVSHTGQGIFPAACSTCHASYTVWTGFTHNPSNCYNTGSFSSHHNATCIQCHTSPTYTTSSCTACHADRGTVCN